MNQTTRRVEKVQMDRWFSAGRTTAELDRRRVLYYAYAGAWTVFELCGKAPDRVRHQTGD